MNNNETTYTLTYIGRRINSDKLHHFYRVELPHDAKENRIILNSKIGNYAIGTTFEIERFKGGVFKGRSEKAIGIASDELIEMWDAEDKAEALRFASNKNFTRVRKTEYDNSIQRLANMYRSLTPSQRRAFMLRVLLDIEQF